MLLPENRWFAAAQGFRQIEEAKAMLSVDSDHLA
jgi:hypothetical protein